MKGLGDLFTGIVIIIAMWSFAVVLRGLPVILALFGTLTGALGACGILACLLLVKALKIKLW